MFSFFKKNNSLTERPAWASFFTDKEYKTFIDGLDVYFMKMNMAYEYDIAEGILRVEQQKFGMGQLGLLNIAQLCKQSVMPEYKKLIADHFEALIRTNQFQQEFDKTIEDFDKVKAYLGTRLYPNDFSAAIGKEHVIAETFAGDICKMLVFDLPDSVTTIKPDKAKKWGKSVAELFDVGIKNIKEKYPVNISQEQLGEITIWFVQGDHFFTPNIVFDLVNHPEMVGSKGSLIGIPHRHVTLIYPIEDLEVVNIITQLIPVIYGMNQEGPGSLSNNLFWYNGTELTNVPYKLTEKNIEISPPANFLDMLNSMND